MCRLAFEEKASRLDAHPPSPKPLDGGATGAIRTGYAVNTLDNERSAVTRFVKAVGPDMQVGHLRASHVRSYILDPRTGLLHNHRSKLATGRPMLPSSFIKARD